MASAEFFYRRCQELRVPLVILSRHAAYKCPMPRSIYDDMAGTGHPIGKRLQATQRASIEALWRRAASPADDAAARMGLPARCDKAWFCNTFCGGAGLERGRDDAVWDLLVSFNMYDPMALMASVPRIRQHFFVETIKRVRGTDHVVIGTSAEQPGVADDKVDALREFLYRGFFKGLTMNYSEFEETQAVANDASRRRENALLKSHSQSDAAHIDMRDDETVFSSLSSTPGAPAPADKARLLDLEGARL